MLITRAVEHLRFYEHGAKQKKSPFLLVPFSPFSPHYPFSFSPAFPSPGLPFSNTFPPGSFLMPFLFPLAKKSEVAL